jgi:hypothetical protein
MNAGIGAGINEASKDIINMWMMNRRIQATRANAEAAKMRAQASLKMADAYAGKLDREGRLGAFADPNAWGGGAPAAQGKKALGPSTPANQRATAAALLNESGPGEDMPAPPPPSAGARPSPPAQRGMAEARPHAMAYATPRPAPPPIPQNENYPGAAALVAPQREEPGPPEYIDASSPPLYSEDE